jgi:hypothetical protein
MKRTPLGWRGGGADVVAGEERDGNGGGGERLGCVAARPLRQRAAPGGWDSWNPLPAAAHQC